MIDGEPTSSGTITPRILLCAGRAGRKTDGFVLLQIRPGEDEVVPVGCRRWSDADGLSNWRPRIERPVGDNRVRSPAILYLHGPNGGNQAEESYNEIHVVPGAWIEQDPAAARALDP